MACKPPYQSYLNLKMGNVDRNSRIFRSFGGEFEEFIQCARFSTNDTDALWVVMDWLFCGLFVIEMVRYFLCVLGLFSDNLHRYCLFVRRDFAANYQQTLFYGYS